ncbi:hypothetical protein TrVE_jg7374 [Triparma verrucosa]|uniref:At2g35280-like TPR domain-containing protein n=2 Tax=Triparma TaxID=722752 RepID=A0A9W7BER6_9STRA|nr:hypothetical protein TrST_g13897 [Triparma strigata]GMH88388.1 hypothetical protein TrVE_jg7374 [Triparma verrucosa]
MNMNTHILPFSTSFLLFLHLLHHLTSCQPINIPSTFTDSKSELSQDLTTGYATYTSTPPSNPPPSSTLPDSLLESSGPIQGSITSSSINSEYKPLSTKYGINVETSIPQSHFSQVHNHCTKNKNAESCYFLGLFHLYGLGTVISPLKALRYFREAGKSGHVDGMCACGILLYVGGEEVQRDSREAVKYFRGAVEGGSEYGMWLLGRAYYEGRVEGGVDFVEAGRLFGLSGRMEAIKHLGIMYEYGLIPSEDMEGDEWDGYSSPHKPDYAKAREMYSSAWESGLDDAGYFLGLMWAYGRGVEQDFTRALEMFRQLAMKGHGQGQRYLAIFLVNGHGCPVDYERGRQWFKACERSGDYRVEELCRVEGEQIEELLEKAREKEQELQEMYGEL